jgi:hypothetical protein
VSLNQEGREVPVFEKKFPFEGFLNRDGVHDFETVLEINPAKLNLAQGRVDMEIRVWDYSRRSGGDGNLSMLRHMMVVDTIAPALRVLSRMHHINVGGTGLVVFQASSDTVESGIYVNDLFFHSYPAAEASEEAYRVCYFGIPYDIKSHPEVYLWAEDRAGNHTKTTFYYHIRRTQFPTDRIYLTESFLKTLLSDFSSYPFGPDDALIDRFLKINRQVRAKNAASFREVAQETSPDKLWEGAWQRLDRSATTGRFAEKRLYFYEGKKVDEQTHTGVDLASLANAEVKAANSGRVIYADRLGIYGLTIVLDHGQGLASVYGHMSETRVQVGDKVEQNQAIGRTGQTGLAGGDHLHFAVMVQGHFVNPIEWWDAHWIRDNVTRKLNRIEK